MNFKFNYYWLLLLVPLTFICWFYISKEENRPLRTLAYYGPKGSMHGNDTSYHSIPDFKFTDQYGQTFTSDSVKNKIYVAEFFFTTCQTICPIMNTHLTRVYRLFHDDPEFLILSHTVDPETDSANVLKSYADARGVNNRRWIFVTGTKPDLYRQARKGYLLSADEGNGGAEDFVHTQNFALVDKEKHIRGFYDGTDSVDVNRLIADIRLLQQEYEHRANSAH